MTGLAPNFTSVSSNVLPAGTRATGDARARRPFRRANQCHRRPERSAVRCCSLNNLALPRCAQGARHDRRAPERCRRADPRRQTVVRPEKAPPVPRAARPGRHAAKLLLSIGGRLRPAARTRDLWRAAHRHRAVTGPDEAWRPTQARQIRCGAARAAVPGRRTHSGARADRCGRTRARSRRRHVGQAIGSTSKIC